MPGRVCFAGEDLDWITGPTIVCAINRRLTVTVKPAPKPGNGIAIWSGMYEGGCRTVALDEIDSYQHRMHNHIQASLVAMKRHGIDLMPSTIVVESQIPVSAGVASSAAVCVGAIAAMARSSGRSLALEEICRLAFYAEESELKTGAGQMDFYSCALGGLRYMDSACRPPRDIQEYDLPEDPIIVLVDTQTPKTTAVSIAEKRTRLLRGDPGMLSYVSAANQIVGALREDLANGAPLEVIGSLIHRCHHHLKEDLRVSTDLLDASVEVCLRHGALGAKLTGSGHGGCLFALARRQHVPNIVRALGALPVKVHVARVTRAGLRVESARARSKSQ